MKNCYQCFLFLPLLYLGRTGFRHEHTHTKEEVVYGILNPDGSVENIYVVNSFEGGLITDYGNYSEVSNMTTSEKLIQNGDTIKIKTSADRFYYQGTPEAQVLPWDIVIKYKLDEKEIAASKLAGKDGALVITVSTKKNKMQIPYFMKIICCKSLWPWMLKNARILYLQRQHLPMRVKTR